MFVFIRRILLTQATVAIGRTKRAAISPECPDVGTAMFRRTLPLVVTMTVAACGCAPEQPAESASVTTITAEPEELAEGRGGAENQASVPTSQRGIEIVMTGRGPIVDREAYLELMTYVGSLVTDLKVDRYIVRGRGVEGGRHFCIQLAHPAFMEEIAARLDQIEPDVRTTEYAWSRATECGINR